MAGPRPITKMGGNAINRPRAADDFATIRARMEELRHERERTKPSEKVQRDPPLPRGGSIRWPPSEIRKGPGRERDCRFRRKPLTQHLGSLLEPRFLGWCCGENFRLGFGQHGPQRDR